MAYTKKTTKKNTTKNIDVEPILEEPVEVAEDIEVEEPVKVKESAPKKKVFHSDDPILCRSITPGRLCLEGGATHMVYRWMDYGSEAEIEYKDLANAVRSHHKIVFNPSIIIEDEDFVNEFIELKKFYTEKFTLKELTDILYMNEDKMAEAISVLPSGAKDQLINIISTKVSNGELDSVKKIKALENILKVDFSLVAEMK